METKHNPTRPRGGYVPPPPPSPVDAQLALIPHEVDRALIHQRAVDGYVNATAMCKAVGKQFSDYSRMATTQDFLNELSSVRGIPRTLLVLSIQGGRAELQGTWVHPDVAIHLGQWCSPRFAVAVSQWVREWMTGRSSARNLPYHFRRYMANRTEIPSTHFSMLNEIMFGLVGPMECAGYTLPERLVPDISEGRMFCNWLRNEKGIDPGGFPMYRHVYEDGRAYPARLYPNELLADFRHHFHAVWLPSRAAAYFAEKDPSALPYLPKALAASQIVAA